jgi:hypothetical protein
MKKRDGVNVGVKEDHLALFGSLLQWHFVLFLFHLDLPNLNHPVSLFQRSFILYFFFLCKNTIASHENNVQ